MHDTEPAPDAPRRAAAAARRHRLRACGLDGSAPRRNRCPASGRRGRGKPAASRSTTRPIAGSRCRRRCAMPTGRRPAATRRMSWAIRRCASGWAGVPGLDIGAGGGYRRKIIAQPVVAGGRIFTMDTDAVVSAFDIASGGRIWRIDTTTEEDDSTNVGGGLAVDGGTLYAGERAGRAGRARRRHGHDPLAQAAAAPRPAPRPPSPRAGCSSPPSTTSCWPSRPPTAPSSGATRQPTRPTSDARPPAPAYADGLVVAGFGSGELVGLRADTGIGDLDRQPRRRRAAATALVDFSAIRGLPVITNGQVYADRHRRAAASHSTCAPAGGCGSARSPARTDAVGSPATGCSCSPLDQQIAAVNADDGHVAWVTAAAALGGHGEEEGPDHLGRPGAGRRPADRGRHQRSRRCRSAPIPARSSASRTCPARRRSAPVVAGGTVLRGHRRRQRCWRCADGARCCPSSSSPAGRMSANRRCSTGWPGGAPALVADTPGVTRDRKEAEAMLRGRHGAAGRYRRAGGGGAGDAGRADARRLRHRGRRRPTSWCSWSTRAPA